MENHCLDVYLFKSAAHKAAAKPLFVLVLGAGWSVTTVGVSK